MAKSKVKRTGSSFIIEGEIDFENGVISVEEIGDYPIEKVLKQFDGKLVKIRIDEPDEEIFEVPKE